MKDVYLTKLETLAQDEVMVAAIYDKFLDKMVEAMPKTKNEVDDRIVGQKYRAYEKAKEIIDLVFDEIHALRNVSRNNKPFNKSL